MCYRLYMLCNHSSTQLRLLMTQVLEYIDEAMPPETPLAFGLHPNAEIGFKLREAERFCANVLCLQPREAGGEGGMSVEEKAKMVRAQLDAQASSCRNYALAAMLLSCRAS